MEKSQGQDPLKNPLYISRKKSKAELVAASLAFTITFGFLIYLFYVAAFVSENPPEFSLEFHPKPKPGKEVRFHLLVKNISRQTAEEVSVDVVMIRNGSMADRRTLNFDFIPRNSVREGWVVFNEPLKEGDQLVPQVSGYRKP